MEKTQEEINKWLEDTVSDLFMDFLYYDRKEDEEMHYSELKKLMDDGKISKSDMKKVFINQIEEEYK